MFFYFYVILSVGSRTVVEEHRGDVPFSPSVLLGVTPFPLNGSGSAYRSEYCRNKAATDSWQAGYFILSFTNFTVHVCTDTTRLVHYFSKLTLERPSRSNLLIHKCGEKMDHICENCLRVDWLWIENVYGCESHCLSNVNPLNRPHLQTKTTCISHAGQLPEGWEMHREPESLVWRSCHHLLALIKLFS